MSVHLRPPAQSALRVIVVCQRLRLQHRNLQNLRPLPNRLRRQLHRQNLLRRQLHPQNQGPRQDRCHLLHQSQLVVVAEGPRNQSRRLLLLRADVPVYYGSSCLDSVFNTQRGRCGFTNQAARIACPK